MMGAVHRYIRRPWLVTAGLLLLVAGSARFLRHDRPSESASRGEAAVPHRLSARPARPFAMVVSLAPDDSFKHVVLAPLGAPDGPRFVTPLTCERVYYAGSRGLCLESRSTGSGSATHMAHVFDEQFERLRRLTLTGPPSRTRLSPDGRRAAFTVFDEGHSYADGIFSTRTTIIDTAAGDVIGDLESWSITRDGRPFVNRDFNFWGVTFASDGNRFFATLRSQGRYYLIEGDVDARTAHVVLQGGECPSLSPDQTRVAFKRRLGGSQGWWQLAVLDLVTNDVHPLAGDTESVDDQVEWLDAGHLLYFRPGAQGNVVWVLATQGDSAPEPFARDAFSPAIVR